MKKLFLLFFVLSCNSILAQKKYEREFGIKEKDVPEKAVIFINNMSFDKTVKWYREEGLTGESIEAKTTYKKNKFSIEFDTLGNVEDIEIMTSWSMLEDNTKSSICSRLSSDFKKFKLQKIQLHYTGSSSDLQSFFTSKNGLTKKYEIVVEGKTEEGYQRFEYTFTAEGTFEKRAEIISRNTDILEY